MNEKGMLIFFFGKMGSGKTTLSKQISRHPKMILMFEDEWLQRLYPGEINSLEDYLKYSSRLKSIVIEYIKYLLNMGITVVMDFPANTKRNREWFKHLFSEANSPHELVYLEVDDNTCLKQIKKRALVQPEREKFDTKEMFYQLRKYFQPPSGDEDFNINYYR